MRKYILFIALCFFFSACQQEEEITPQTGQEKPGTAPEEMPVLKGHVQVKFKEEIAPQLNVVRTKAGLSSGITAVDLAGVDLSVYRMERVFPPAGKFEARHREAGLHLWYDIYFDEKIPTRSAVEAYSQLPEVEFVSEVREARLSDYEKVEEPLEPLRSMLAKTRADEVEEEPLPFDDPRLKEMWHYHNAGESVNGLAGAMEGADIGVFEAWKIETGSPDVIVAVMDGGIQFDHPDLAGNMWINEAEMNGTEGVDDDGNGYVDDVYGWNFVTAKNVEGPSGDTIRGNGAITQHEHGTHCAGTISAVNGNGTGVCGIAGGSGKNDGVRLMSCQIFHTNPSTGNQDAYADPNIYVYAADMGAVISSNSWTNGAYEESAFMNSAMRSAIDYFIKYAGTDVSTKVQNGPMNGGLVVFAAANSNSDVKEWPASYSKALTVASMAHNFKRASYSNFGDWIDITAPGGEQSYGDSYAILSTTINSGYAWLQGTSMACPHVAGCAALVLSKFQGPGYTPNELWDRLINSTHNIDGYNPRYKGLLGAGCIDVGVALTPPSTEAPDSSHLRIVDAYDDWAIVEWTVKAAPDGPMNKYVISWSTSPLQPSTTEAADVQTKTVNVRYIAAGTVVRDTVTGLQLGEKYYFSLRAYDRWGGVSEAAPQMAATVTENKAPELTLGWSGDVLVNEGTERTVQIRVNDPEHQQILCRMNKDLPWITVQNEGDTLLNLKLTPDYQAAGIYPLRLMVSDQYGKYTLTDMNIEVLYKEAAPQIVRTFTKLQLPANGRRTTLNLADYFSDPKGRTLMYEVDNSATAIASVQRSGESLIIEPKVPGNTQIMVRALNQGGLSVSQRFNVEVINGDNEDVENAMTAFPNPVKKDLNITLQPEVRGEATLRLYNAAGRVMLYEKVTVGDNGYSIDMSKMQAGTYTLVVEAAGHTWKKNIIKI